MWVGLPWALSIPWVLCLIPLQKVHSKCTEPSKCSNCIWDFLKIPFLKGILCVKCGYIKRTFIGVGAANLQGGKLPAGCSFVCLFAWFWSSCWKRKGARLEFPYHLLLPFLQLCTFCELTQASPSELPTLSELCCVCENSSTS